MFHGNQTSAKPTVKNRVAKHDVDGTSRPDSTAISAGETAFGEDCATQQRRDDLLADRELVCRCLAGEVAAWEQLYEECHDRLLLSIAVMLGGAATDSSLVEEISARVWYALVANDGEMLGRYKPDRGARLITFMRAIAKDETSRYFRTESRRKERELAAFRDKGQNYTADFGQAAASIEEFLATLTPYERGFCASQLMSSAGETSPEVQQPPTSASAWQLTHRIHRKLLAFLHQDP